MRNRVVAALAGALLVSACAETLDGEPVASTPAGAAQEFPAPPAAGALGSELYAAGVTVRAEVEGGDVNTITFAQDGMVRNRVHSTNQLVEGRWWVSNNELCLRWKGASRQECWPYASALQPGETVTLRSDRGNTARVTLISGSPG